MKNTSEHHLPFILIFISLAFIFLVIYFPSSREMVPAGLPQVPGPDENGQIISHSPPPSPSGRIGIQAGHWKPEELPESMKELRSSTGARQNGVNEADINLRVAEMTAVLLRKIGWEVDVLPTTIPPAYQADAFISLHADWGHNGRPRGWKTAPPWRPSPASLSLESSLKKSFYTAGLPEDGDNITVNMRGYYGFNYRYYSHAVSPYTPSVLVEMGYITNSLDLLLLTDGAPRMAEILAQGVMEFLQTQESKGPLWLVPPEYPPLVVGSSGAVVRKHAQPQSSRLTEIASGARVFILQKKENWVEVFIRDPQPLTGWVYQGDLLGGLRE